MDVVLTVIAGLSLSLAVVMGVILLRMMRAERERSEARVAVLAAAAAELDDPLPLRTHLADVEATGLAHSIPAVHDLFAADEAPSPWSRRLAVAGGLAACLTLAAFALLRGAGPAVAPAAVAEAQQAPLELLSLRHQQAGGSLTISGVVHNPRNGSALTQVHATALLLARDGSEVGNGRAALDFMTLAPGDESPFVITVPVTTAVARYRVGFRRPDGSVIAHVDRRSDGSSARIADISGSTPWAH